MNFIRYYFKTSLFAFIVLAIMAAFPTVYLVNGGTFIKSLVGYIPILVLLLIHTILLITAYDEDTKY